MKEKVLRWSMITVPGAVGSVVLSTLAFFPWATDLEVTAKDTEEQRAFYTKVYANTPHPTDLDLTEYAKGAVGAHGAHINQGTKARLKRFISKHGIANGRGLEIGSGVGYLQDVMDDYTGLDISPSVARFYTKRLVLGSATAMPFGDNEFDIAFECNILEHVPNPEQELREMRRVVKLGGCIYLDPAWGVSPFLAQGYTVRPYTDFGLGGRFLKAIEPVVSSSAFRTTHVIPTRILRMTASNLGPTRFHYTRLSPNYETYCV